jgi:hypothetical protein
MVESSISPLAVDQVEKLALEAKVRSLRLIHYLLVGNAFLPDIARAVHGG